jgi:hypothetical protein
VLDATRGSLYVASTDSALYALDVNDPARLSLRWKYSTGERAGEGKTIFVFQQKDCFLIWIATVRGRERCQGMTWWWLGRGRLVAQYD